MPLLLLLLLCLGEIDAFSPLPIQRRNSGIRQLHSTTPRNGNAASFYSSSNQTLFELSTSPITVVEEEETREVSSLPPIQDEQVAASISPPRPRNQKAAIVLNVNAGSVTPDLCDVANEVFGEANVFLTSTEDEARQAVRHIVDQHYSLVVPVGGDGTLSTLLTLMAQDIIKDNVSMNINDAMKELPFIGYIPLGTGNGVGSVVGCSVGKKSLRNVLPGAKRRKRRHLQQLFERLQQVAQDDSSDDSNYEVVELPMMQVTMHNDPSTSELCFFAGVGFDSLMLNDFKRIKAWSKRTGVLTKLLSSVTGYCVALVVQTLPKCVFQGKHNINVQLTTRHPEETTWIDHRRGDVMRKVSGKVLYSGKTGILAAGTSPFYGGGLRLFPFARMTLDKMHLRLGRIHPLVGFANIPRIFSGSYRDTSDRFGCIDFVGTDFDVQVSSEDEKDDGFPFQHSGESVGHAENFRLQVVKEPVRFVSFTEKSWNNHGAESKDEKSP